MRMVFASGGKANIIDAHRWHKAGQSDPTQVSITFSSQIEEACMKPGVELCMVSDADDGRTLRDGNLCLRHIGKPQGKGIFYHLADLRHCVRILRISLKHRADFLLIDSGVVQFYMLLLFKVFGINVVPIMHNSLWPNGFRKGGFLKGLVFRLDALFWKFVPAFVLVVSPAIRRQIVEVAGQPSYPVHQFTAQFSEQYFAAISPPPAHGDRPFRVMFVGRATREKGVLDIAEIAGILESRHPGLVRWTICGDGPDLDELRRIVADKRLNGAIDVRGRVLPADMATLYGNMHACIVPTRTDFAEGLAMTAIESVLAGRPVVTNKVVPALEFIRDAAVEAVSDDVESYARAIEALATDRTYYEELRSKTKGAALQFFDRGQGLAKVLENALRDFRR